MATRGKSINLFFAIWKREFPQYIQAQAKRKLIFMPSILSPQPLQKQPTSNLSPQPYHF